MFVKVIKQNGRRDGNSTILVLNNGVILDAPCVATGWANFPKVHRWVKSIITLGQVKMSILARINSSSLGHAGFTTTIM